MISLGRQKMENFQICFFDDFSVEFMIFDDEIYDLVSLDVEAKRGNHKILTKKNVTKSYKNAKQKHAKHHTNFIKNHKSMIFSFFFKFVIMFFWSFFLIFCFCFFKNFSVFLMFF